MTGMPSELMQALYQGKADEAKAIAAVRSDLDLLEAAAIGDLERVSVLLDEDPSLVNAWSDDGFTPLHYAAFFGQAATAKLLIERRADLEARSANREFALDAAPLHSAVAARERGTIEVLLDAGADVNAVQHGGFTPLLEAAQTGQAEVVELLLERGADPDAKLDDGRTATELARAARESS